MQASPQHITVLPIICLLIAASLWGVFWYPLRLLETYGLNGLWSSLLVYCGTLLVALPIVIRRRREIAQQPWSLLAILLCSGWCNTAFILALLEGEVVRVILLFYLSPIWATLLARLVLKEQLSLAAYSITVLALAGAMIMLWSPEVGYPWPQNQADWLAISSGLAFAFTNLFVHLTKGASIELKTAVSWLGVIAVAGLILLLDSSAMAPKDVDGIVFALILGAAGMTVMTFCVVYGVTHMPVHRSAVILLFEVFIGGLSAYLLTEERMSWLEWFGGGIVILAAYLAARQHNQQVMIE